MQAEEDYERDYMWQLAEEEASRKKRPTNCGRGSTRKGACGKRTKAAAELAKLKARNMAGMFRAVEQNISDQRTKEDWERLQGQVDE